MDGDLNSLKWTTVLATHLSGALALAFTHLAARRAAGEVSAPVASWLRAALAAGLILLAAVAAGVLTSGGRAFSVIAALAQGVFVGLPVAWLLDAALDLQANLTSHARNKAIAAAIVLAVGVDAFFIEPGALEVNEHWVEVDELERPLRIAVLADLQTDRLTDYEREVLKAIREAKPDVILIAGDLLQRGYGPNVQELRRQLRTMMLEEWGSAEHPRIGPAFVVEGDVELRGWEDMFKGLPVQPLALHQGRQTVTLAEPGLDITGLSLHASRQLPSPIPRPSRRPHVVFGHAPDFSLGDVDADVLLAGHTHGGQVQLPGIGPLMTLSDVPRAWASGRTRLESGATLFVSRGVGMERSTAPRLRFLCRPEIVIVELRGPI